MNGWMLIARAEMPGMFPLSRRCAQFWGYLLKTQGIYIPGFAGIYPAEMTGQVIKGKSRITSGFEIRKGTPQF